MASRRESYPDTGDEPPRGGDEEAEPGPGPGPLPGRTAALEESCGEGALEEGAFEENALGEDPAGEDAAGSGADSSRVVGRAETGAGEGSAAGAAFCPGPRSLPADGGRSDRSITGSLGACPGVIP